MTSSLSVQCKAVSDQLVLFSCSNLWMYCVATRLLKFFPSDTVAAIISWTVKVYVLPLLVVGRRILSVQPDKKSLGYHLVVDNAMTEWVSANVEKSVQPHSIQDVYKTQPSQQ